MLAEKTRAGGHKSISFLCESLTSVKCTNLASHGSFLAITSLHRGHKSLHIRAFVPPVSQGQPLEPRPPQKALMCTCFVYAAAHCKSGAHHWRVSHWPSRSSHLLLWFTGSVNQQSAISHVIYGLATSPGPTVATVSAS